MTFHGGYAFGIGTASLLEASYSILSTEDTLEGLRSRLSEKKIFIDSSDADCFTQELTWAALNDILDVTIPIDDQPDHRMRRRALLTVTELSRPPISTADAYLRLHLLSRRKILPNDANLTGLTDLMPQLVRTNAGFYPADDLEVVSGLRPPVRIQAIHAFPPMASFVVPSRVRIAETARVELGAYLAPGTSVMHQGSIEHNAGTLGECLVEGHIASGSVIGAGSHVGGGARIMSPNAAPAPVGIGTRCLIGANAVVSISLGDGCTVEAGLYIGPDSLVRLDGGEAVPAQNLAGRTGLLLRRHSQYGHVEALRTQHDWGELNPALHVYN